MWLKKLVSTAASFGIFYWVAIHTHEAGHYLAAWQLNIPGNVTYTWLGGRFNYDPQWALQYYIPGVGYQIPWDWLVGLSGGLLVALVFGTLALLAWWQSDTCPWETDDLFGLAPIATFNLAYGVTEALGIGVYLGTLLGVLVMTPVFIVSLLKVLKWLEEG